MASPEFPTPAPGGDQPAVSQNNTGSQHAAASRGNWPHGPRDGLSRRLSGATPSRPAADRLIEQRHNAQIWIAWVCAAGMALTLLARCAYPLPAEPAAPQPKQEHRPMDDVDRITEQTETMLAQRISNRVRYEGQSATHCDECGDPIPERRRELIAGCRTSADCQGLIEQRGYA